MPSIKDLWPDKWLKPETLQGKRVFVTIESATVESLYNPRTHRHEPRLILTFWGKTLRMPLNKTQARSVAAITATDDYSEWIGHSAILAATTAPNGSPTITILEPQTRTSATAQDADSQSTF